MDPGGDDAWALKVLSENEKKGNYKIIGVVCSFANTNRTYAIRNVFMVLELIERLDVSYLSIKC